ncbi:hypothetical protein DFS28_111153 [Pseudomonas sp. 478]|nr:hypothetical protein DFS28_111153 [Pseudomonas sp. 478]TCV44436.1 hypothetical protein EDB99_121107 [Pseudomonas sp. 460]
MPKRFPFLLKEMTYICTADNLLPLQEADHV